jgi:hypothetical protein
VVARYVCPRAIQMCIVLQLSRKMRNRESESNNENAARVQSTISQTTASFWLSFCMVCSHFGCLVAAGGKVHLIRRPTLMMARCCIYEGMQQNIQIREKTGRAKIVPCSSRAGPTCRSGQIYCFKNTDSALLAGPRGRRYAIHAEEPAVT